MASRMHGMVVANHISFTDIFVINALMPSTFVAKAEIATWPMLGGLVRRAGTIFIERGSRRAAHLTQDTISAHLAGGERVAVFPEGTTSDGQGILPFHAALFQSAVASAAPVICLRIVYRHADGSLATSPAYIGELSLLACLWHIAMERGLTADLVDAGVIPAPHSDRRHTAHSAHQRIAHALKKH